MVLNNNQLQYIMRSLFSTGIDPFLLGLGKTKEDQEIIIIELRYLILNKNFPLDSALFLFRSNPNGGDVSDFGEKDIAFFLKYKGLIRTELTWNPHQLYSSKIIKDVCNINELSDEDFLKTMEKSDFYKTRLFLNSRIYIKHPEIMFSLEDYLNYSPLKAPWKERFPAEIVESVSQEDMYGNIPPNLEAMFSPLFGGKIPKEFIEEIKKIFEKQ